MHRFNVYIWVFAASGDCDYYAEAVEAGSFVGAMLLALEQFSLLSACQISVWPADMLVSECPPHHFQNVALSYECFA
ncbi:MAG TPA: hypothetical protein VFV38_11825 [Ktedonobacteraceae bacterium]|nr:hypothetical protein [Ktedonobacteraceae bacterium]